MEEMAPKFRDRRFLLLLLAGLWTAVGMSGCATVTGLPRATHVDRNGVYQHVQVLENYYGNDVCNVDYCAVLFTHGNSGFYLPRVYTLGPGKPADFNLKYLIPYQVSDGSIVFAPPGSDPTEYTIPSGQIRIQFGVRPDIHNQHPGFGGFGSGF